MLDGSKVERCEVQVTHTVLIIINNQLGITEQWCHYRGSVSHSSTFLIFIRYFHFSCFIFQFLFFIFQYFGQTLNSWWY